jgi:hypothetical protein
MDASIVGGALLRLSSTIPGHLSSDRDTRPDRSSRACHQFYVRILHDLGLIVPPRPWMSSEGPSVNGLAVPSQRWPIKSHGRWNHGRRIGAFHAHIAFGTCGRVSAFIRACGLYSQTDIESAGPSEPKKKPGIRHASAAWPTATFWSRDTRSSASGSELKSSSSVQRRNCSISRRPSMTLAVTCSRLRRVALDRPTSSTDKHSPIALPPEVPSPLPRYSLRWFYRQRTICVVATGPAKNKLLRLSRTARALSYLSGWKAVQLVKGLLRRVDL